MHCVVDVGYIGLAIVIDVWIFGWWGGEVILLIFDQINLELVVRVLADVAAHALP